MRLLIINYEMDDHSPVLAWQAQVARELSGYCEKVVVLTERWRPHNREEPSNLSVHEIVRWRTLLPRVARRGLAVNGQVWDLVRQHRIEACFVHMAHKWVYRLAPVFCWLRIPVVLWYAHGTVTASLRAAHYWATRVVTSTPEGFRIPSDKLRVIGQAVNTALFSPRTPQPMSHELICVGRVSRRKRIDVLVQTMVQLRALAPDLSLRLRVVGPLLTEDDLQYDRELRSQIHDAGVRDSIDLEGCVPQQEIPPLHHRAFLHLNVSETGSMDKTVMESLACGVPVLTSNPAFRDVLRGFPIMRLDDPRPELIARRVLELHQSQADLDPHALRALVVGRHDQASFPHRLLGQIEELL